MKKSNEAKLPQVQEKIKEKIVKTGDSFLALRVLIKRNIKLFLKDKMTVFFSLLAPIIVLLLYILFLGNLQVDSVSNIIASFDPSLNIDEKLITAFINNWMIAGVMGVSCITVALTSNTIMVRDRERGTVNDVLAAPVKRWVIYASYVISCFLITFFICIAVFILSIIYLACTGGLMMSFLDFITIIGVTILSIISSAIISVFIASFIRTEAALGSMCGIFSAAVGFLTGAYMPLSMFPEPIQYLVCFIPGSYSAGLYRNYFLNGPMSVLLETLPDDLVHQLMDSYSVKMKFFGSEISAMFMTTALVISIAIFAAALIIVYSKKKTNIFFNHKNRKKQKFSSK